MANRQFRSQFLFGFQGMPVRLQAHVTFGSSGAPTLDTTISQGISSIVRDSAGKYTITLQDSYNKLIGVNMMQLTGSSAATAPVVTVVSQAVSSSPATIVLQYRAIDNSTATDPASGEQLYLTILLNNSSV